MSSARDRLRSCAAEHFGWTELRPEQLRAMEALTDGRDALVVLPTGAGKSAVYQVMDYEGDQLVVLFDDVGYKTLSVPLVTENDLLHPSS